MGGQIKEFIITEDKKGNKIIRKIAVKEINKRGIRVKIVETTKDKDGKEVDEVVSDKFYPDEKIHGLKKNGKQTYEITGGL